MLKGLIKIERLNRLTPEYFKSSVFLRPFLFWFVVLMLLSLATTVIKACNGQVPTG